MRGYQDPDRRYRERTTAKDWLNSVFAHYLGAALVLAVLLAGMAFSLHACANAAEACIQAGGSYNGDNGDCAMPGHK